MNFKSAPDVISTKNSPRPKPENVSVIWMSALVAPSDEYLQGEGLVWLTGAVCSLAATAGPIVR